MSASVWVALALPNSPANAVPYIDPVDLTPTVDVLNFFYDETTSQLFAREYKGRTDAIDADAGCIGEVKETIVASGAALALVTATPKTVASVVLTPGDWELEGIVHFTGNVATTVTRLTGSLNTVTDALSAVNDRLGRQKPNGATIFSDALSVTQQAGKTRVNVAADTTMYLVAEAAFAVNTCSAYGTIRARRVR